MFAHRAGIGAIETRRGGLRSAVDMAEDAKQPVLAAWLCARVGTNADGSMGGRLLKTWQAEGWKGNKMLAAPKARGSAP